MPLEKIFLTGGTGFFGKSILDMLKNGFRKDSEDVNKVQKTPGVVMENNLQQSIEKTILSHLA